MDRLHANQGEYPGLEGIEDVDVVFTNADPHHQTVLHMVEIEAEE